MNLAVPIVVGGVYELLVALGLVATAVTAIALANNTSLPAKVRQWLLDHTTEFDEQSKRSEPREPTPVTYPALFTWDTIQQQKVAIKTLTLSNRNDPMVKNLSGLVGDGEVWQADLLHGDHFSPQHTKIFSPAHSIMYMNIQLD